MKGIQKVIAGIVLSLSRTRIPATQPMAIPGKIPELIWKVRYNYFDHNGILRDARMKVRVVKREIPLRMEHAPDGLEYC
jgi:hypothetical protein